MTKKPPFSGTVATDAAPQEPGPHRAACVGLAKRVAKGTLVTVKASDFLAATGGLEERFTQTEIRQSNEDFEVLRRYAIFIDLCERADGYVVSEGSDHAKALDVLLAAGIVVETGPSFASRAGYRRFVRRTDRVRYLEEELAKLQAKFELEEEP